MKGHKLLKKLKLFMSAEQREQVAQRDSLKTLLNKLRKRRDLLKGALGNAGSESDRHRILEEMQILKVHRQKGLALLQQLQSKCPAEQIKAEPEPAQAQRGVDPTAKAPTLELIPSRRTRPVDTGLALRERPSHWPWRVA